MGDPQSGARRRWTLPVQLGVFVVTTLAFTWPLAAQLAHGFLHIVPNPDLLARSDCYLNAWILAWDVDHLRHGTGGLFDANILYPLRNTLALGEHLLGEAPIALAVGPFSASAVAANNVVVLASFVLGATGAALLAADLGAPPLAATLGGALFAFSPFRFAQLEHVQVLSTEWMPFGLLCLERLLRSGRGRWAAGLAACFVQQGLCSLYMVYYFGFALALLLGFRVLARCPTVAGGYRRAAAAILLAGALLGPLMLPYVRARDDYGLDRDPRQALLLSAVADTYLQSVVAPRAYLQRRYRGDGGGTLVGLGTLALAALGVAAGAAATRGGRRTATAYLATAVALALLSMGSCLRLHPTVVCEWPGPYALLVRMVPGLEALRVPVRLAEPTILLLSVLAALGAGAVLRAARTRPARVAAIVLLAAVGVAEAWRPRLFVLSPPLDDDAPLDAWLAARPGDVPTVELPLGPDDAYYMLRSTRHWKRLVNGYAWSPVQAYLHHVFATFPDERSRRLVTDLGVRLVVVHRATAPPSARALCDGAAPSWLARRYDDARACALEVEGVPPPVPDARDPAVALTDARITDDAGADAAAVHDGDVATRWTEPVSPTTTGWLEIDLPRPLRVSGIVLRLGRNLGDYLRRYRVESSADGTAWTTLAGEPLAPAPLPQARADPDDLVVDIPVPPTVTSRLRLVRPAADGPDPLLWEMWPRWGAREIALRAAPDG